MYLNIIAGVRNFLIKESLLTNHRTFNDDRGHLDNKMLMYERETPIFKIPFMNPESKKKDKKNIHKLMNAIQYECKSEN